MPPRPTISGANLPILPTYVFEALELGVRVGSYVAKTVVFIGTQAHGPFTPVGTCLLVRYDGGLFQFPFALTAKHVLDQIAGDNVWIRYNTESGEARTLKIAKKSAWTTAPEIDLAVLPFSTDGLDFDQQFIVVDRAHWENAFKDVWSPELGDEVVTIGLYTSHYGALKNAPVVRVGNIAALPGEPVMTDKGYVKGYLVETRSIAGLSGSPVFLNPPPMRMNNGEIEYLPEQSPIPIGIMLGYHVIVTAEDQIPVPQMYRHKHRATGAKLSRDEKNTGLAVVATLTHVFDLFETPEAQNVIKKSTEHHLKGSGFRPASASPPEATQVVPEPDNPSHKEDFRHLLDAAAKTKQ